MGRRPGPPGRRPRDRRQQIIALARGGYGEPLYSPIPKGYFAHSEDVPRYEYDVAKAKALLAEAGYPNGLDVTMTNFDTFKLTSEVIIEQIKAVSFRVTSEMLDQPTFIGRVIKNEGINFTVRRPPARSGHLADRRADPEGRRDLHQRYDLEKELEPPDASWTRRSGSSSTSRSSGRS